MWKRDRNARKLIDEGPKGDYTKAGKLKVEARTGNYAGQRNL